MESIIRLGDDPARPTNPFLGILYAEDFDEIAAPGSPEEAETLPPEPAITQDDVDAACARAVATARLEWQADEARDRRELLDSIAAAIGDAAAAAETVALQSADALARTILGCVAAALPQFCETHGPSEARTLVARLLPLLRSEPRVVIRVHADLVRVLQAEFDSTDNDFGQSLVIRSGLSVRGDLKVNWEAGSLIRDTRKIIQSIHDALGQLGLHLPSDQAAKKELAHAD